MQHEVLSPCLAMIAPLGHDKQRPRYSMLPQNGRRMGLHAFEAVVKGNRKIFWTTTGLRNFRGGNETIACLDCQVDVPAKLCRGYVIDTHFRLPDRVIAEDPTGLTLASARYGGEQVAFAEHARRSDMFAPKSYTVNELFE